MHLGLVLHNQIAQRFLSSLKMHVKSALCVFSNSLLHDIKHSHMFKGILLV